MIKIEVEDIHKYEPTYENMGFRTQRAICGNCHNSDYEVERYPIVRWNWWCSLFKDAFLLPVKRTASCNYWRKESEHKTRGEHKDEQ